MIYNWSESSTSIDYDQHILLELVPRCNVMLSLEYLLSFALYYHYNLLYLFAFNFLYNQVDYMIDALGSLSHFRNAIHASMEKVNHVPPLVHPLSSPTSCPTSLLSHLLSTLSPLPPLIHPLSSPTLCYSLMYSLGVDELRRRELALSFAPQPFLSPKCKNMYHTTYLCIVRSLLYRLGPCHWNTMPLLLRSSFLPCRRFLQLPRKRLQCIPSVHNGT